MLTYYPCYLVCENLFRVCGFESDIWRCETDVVDGQDKNDMRTFFPGQPFRHNEELIAVCTPSIKGAAARLEGGIFWSRLFYFLLFFSCLMVDIS
jgi:hypothetical protein